MLQDIHSLGHFHLEEYIVNIIQRSSQLGGKNTLIWEPVIIFPAFLEHLSIYGQCYCLLWQSLAIQVAEDPRSWVELSQACTCHQITASTQISSATELDPTQTRSQKVSKFGIDSDKIHGNPRKIGWLLTFFGMWIPIYEIILHPFCGGMWGPGLQKGWTISLTEVI